MREFRLSIIPCICPFPSACKRFVASGKLFFSFVPFSLESVNLSMQPLPLPPGPPRWIFFSANLAWIQIIVPRRPGFFRFGVIGKKIHSGPFPALIFVRFFFSFFSREGRRRVISHDLLLSTSFYRIPPPPVPPSPPSTVDQPFSRSLSLRRLLVCGFPFPATNRPPPCPRSPQ